MQYMFSVLVLGDSITAIEYSEQAKLENISQDQEFSKWGVHLQFPPDECDFELAIPVAMPNFDAIIPASDSIIYFLNPNSASEVEVFKEIMNTIQKVRRDIPTVVVFRDPENFISLPTNQLLGFIWEAYPFEAYIADYASKNQLREILDTIATALMRGEILINYNTAWLQIPILSQKANLNIIEQNWNNAARMAEKIAKISEKLGIMDQNVYAEQSAWLYAKAGDLLKASNVIKKINPIFAERYRRMYTDYLMNEGHQLNREKKFAMAASKYENAGNWAKIELSDPPLMKQMYQYAIFAWISACNIKNAFVLLENFDHNEMIQILEKTTQKIAGVADFLVTQGQGELAKIQIYLSFEQFQKAGLFDSIKVLGDKAVQILKNIIEKELQQEDVEAAKSTYDEITNMWESFDVKRENLDSYLEKIERLFIKERNFPKFEALLSKIQSLDIQKTLTEERMKEEDKIKAEAKQGELLDQTAAMETLMKYVKEEAIILYEMNKNIFAQAEKWSKSNEYTKAAQIVKRQAEWLRFIGQERLSYDVLEYVLNIYLQDNAIGMFLNEVQFLPEDRRKEFLKKVIATIQTTFEKISEKTQQAEFESLINTMIHLYRNLLLYEESRIFAEIYVNNLVHHGALIASHPEERSIQQSLEITRKISQISQSYLDNRAFDLDAIYSKVIEFYIEKKDLVNARAYNDKLKNKTLAVEYNGKVEKIESLHSGEAAQKAKELQEMKIFADKLHSLKIISRDQKMAQPNLIRMRLGLKRRYFQEGIDKILVNDLLSAINAYANSAIELVKTKKFELAGVNMAVIGIISLLNKSPQLLTEKIIKIDDELGLSRVVFHETYQMKLLDYLSQMVQFRNLDYLKEALKLLEVLPFFPEEQLMLDVLIGNGNIKDKLNEYRKQTGVAPIIQTGTNHTILINKLEFDQGIFNRRQIYESKYWSHCQDHFAKQNYDQASVIYLGHIEELILRKSEKIASISIVMGFLSLLKIKSGFDTYKEFEKFYFRLCKQNEILSQFPEIKLLDLFLSKFDSTTDQNMVKEISEAFQTRLALYDWERAFITSLFTHPTSSNNTSIETAKPGVVLAGSPINQDDDSLLTQQIVVLTQQLASMKKDLNEIKNKRELGRRAYYNEIFDVLKKNNFVDASEKYLSLTKRMARRNDYDLGSLMVLFSTLSRIKAKHPLNEIKNNINEVLKSLGIVEKILGESIGVKLSYFVLDAMNSQNEGIKQNLKNLLKQIPYLDEEYNLFQF